MKNYLVFLGQWSEMMPIWTFYSSFLAFLVPQKLRISWLNILSGTACLDDSNYLPCRVNQKRFQTVQTISNQVLGEETLSSRTFPYKPLGIAVGASSSKNLKVSNMSSTNLITRKVLICSLHLASSSSTFLWQMMM